VRARPIPSLFRQFSAPVHVHADLSLEDRLFLIGSDPDPFNRWEAAQQIALSMLADAAAALRAKKTPKFDPRFAEELGRLAANDDLDPAFRALALNLPSETDVAQAIAQDVDPDAIHAAREALVAFVGRTIGDEVAEASARVAPPKVYSPDAKSAGKRAFAHAAWALKAAGGTMSGADLLARYDAAGNLTDRLAALRLLVHFGLDGADDALSRFESRYHDNALVLDKWFMVQATAPSHASLDAVERLTKHPGFSFKNPNRIYALVRSFAAANPVGFNRPDGAGYRFVARVIGDLDKHNPSVAARIATAFRSWRMLEPGRQGEAEKALRGLQETAPLSRDLGDIVGRTLAG
jgi:aminopeptidase N